MIIHLFFSVVDKWYVVVLTKTKEKDGVTKYYVNRRVSRKQFSSPHS